MTPIQALLAVSATSGVLLMLGILAADQAARYEFHMWFYAIALAWLFSTVFGILNILRARAQYFHLDGKYIWCAFYSNLILFSVYIGSSVIIQRINIRNDEKRFEDFKNVVASGYIMGDPPPVHFHDYIPFLLYLFGSVLLFMFLWSRSGHSYK